MRTTVLATLSGLVLSLSAQAQNSDCEKQAREEHRAAMQQIDRSEGHFAQRMKELGVALDEKLEACGVAIEGAHKPIYHIPEQPINHIPEQPPMPRMDSNVRAALDALVGTERAPGDDEGCVHKMRDVCGKIRMGQVEEVKTCLLDHGNELNPRCLNHWRRHVITNLSRDN